MNIKKMILATLALGVLGSSLAEVLPRTRVYGAKITVNYISLSSYYTGIFDQARPYWNGKSSQVSVNKSSTVNSANDAYKVYVGSTSDPTVFGQTVCYTKDFASNYSQTSLVNDWFKCQVTLFDTNMTTYKLTQTQRLQTAIHEIGHTLKLDHSSAPAYTSVMIDSLIDQASTPQTIDYQDLKSKWGQ